MSSQEGAGEGAAALGSVLQIAGMFILLAGLWIITIDIAGGMELQLNSFAPTVVIAGLVSFAVGTLTLRIARDELRLQEQSYSLESAPRSSPETKIVRLTSPPRTRVCPSCGFENDTGTFFCIACNSSMWLDGKPLGVPLERSVVMRKIRRVIALRKIKHTLGLIILAIAVSAPFATNLAVAYLAINDYSALKIARVYFSAPTSSPNGTLSIDLDLLDSEGHLAMSSAKFTFTLNNTERHAFGCPSSSSENIIVPPSPFPCRLTVYDVTAAQLEGATIVIKVSGIAAVFLYRQQITRSAAISCDSKCASAYGFRVP